MTKEELRTALMKRAAKKLGGDWWWESDVDNPFGVSLLAIGVPEVKKARVARVELYTFREVNNGLKPQLEARDNHKSALRMVGWPIYRKGKITTWTLPARFEYDTLVERVRTREQHAANRSKSARLAAARQRRFNQRLEEERFRRARKAD